MALLATRRPNLAGGAAGAVTFSPATAGGGGDTFPADPRGVLLVNNTSGSSINATIATPGTDRYSQNRPEVVAACPTGVITAISLPGSGFPEDLADPADEYVHVTWSAVTNVNVAYLVA